MLKVKKVKKVVPETYEPKKFYFLLKRTPEQIKKVYPVPYKFEIDYKKLKEFL